MSNKHLSDKEAKAILLKWPTRTDSVWEPPTGSGYWIQAQPKNSDSKTATPTLRTPGSKLFKTQPDGMHAFLNEDAYADVVCIESCATIQNLNDKRSRYAADVRSVVLHCPLEWLLEVVDLQKGGLHPRWQATKTISDKPTADLLLPVRFLRVLMAIPNELYKTWTAENVPAGHEYFCRHSSLKNYSDPHMQKFLRQLSMRCHFRTEPGR